MSYLKNRHTLYFRDSEFFEWARKEARKKKISMAELFRRQKEELEEFRKGVKNDNS